MGGAVIGLNSSLRNNGASAAAMEQLYNLLNGKTGTRYFVINGYGEPLGPSAARPWTPTGANGVSEFVNSGSIWIDYCGWPMYYQNSTNGVQTTLGAAGFQSFASAVGYAWLGGETLAPGFGNIAGGYPYRRGYDLSATQHGVYLPQGTPNGTPIAAGGYSSMLALNHGSTGWYFYATADGGTAFQSPQAVPTPLYAAFILACLSGKASFGYQGTTITIAHEPYLATQHKVVTTQPGPSTPYPTGSSSGSTSSGSTSSGSGGVTVTTTSGPGPNSTSSSSATTGTNFVAPASGPPLWEVAGLAAAAGLVTLGGYLLLKK